MPRKRRFIEPSQFRPALHDLGNRIGREPVAEMAMPVHAAKHPARSNACRRDPGLVRERRACLGSGPPDRNHLPLSLLVALGAPDRDPQPLGGDGHIRHVHTDRFGASEGSGEADQPITVGREEFSDQRHINALDPAQVLADIVNRPGASFRGSMRQAGVP